MKVDSFGADALLPPPALCIETQTAEYNQLEELQQRVFLRCLSRIWSKDHPPDEKPRVVDRRFVPTARLRCRRQHDLNTQLQLHSIRREVCQLDVRPTGCDLD